MTPEFSPAMLALFIEGRVVALGCGGGGWPLKGSARKAAAKVVVWDLSKRARLPRKAVEQARRGRLLCGAARAGLWGALGVVPGDFRILLLDDGTQEAVA